MYDLAVVGSGAAGIAAVKQALKLGLKTVLIEKNQDSFGGTCINRGCIPAKFFINGARHGKRWEDIFAAKAAVLAKIKEPLYKHLTTRGLEVIYGDAAFIDNQTIAVKNQNINAKNFLITTGSLPKRIAQGDNVIFAEDIFNLKTLPDKILVIGGGYIGIEMASLFCACGAAVTVVEKEERILLGFDNRLANRYRIILETKGIKIETGKTISDYNFKDFGLVAMGVGREAATASLGLDKAGVSLDERGWVKVDKYFRTSAEHIYACGDVTGRMMLAYTGEYQAALCVKNITRNLGAQPEEEDYSGIAYCVFGIPQIARTGILEEEAKLKSIKYRVIKSNFLKFSAAYVYDDNDGFIQILVGEDDTILGADIISNRAGDLISILALCVKNRLKVDALKDCLLVHPSLSEIITLLFREESDK